MRYLLSICLITISCHCNIFAWNQVGHQLISEIAYSELTKDKQVKLDKVLDNLIKNLPPDEKKIYKNQPYQLSKLAKLSVLPDSWKNRTLESIMYNLRIDDNEFNNNLPLSKTFDWHYKDSLVPEKTNSKNYNKQNMGKLDIVFDPLLINTKSTKNLPEKALGIIFLSHLLADAHQPMHAMTKILDQKLDKGGNRFCLQKASKLTEHCTYNLHSYWDSGAKTLNPKQNLGNLQKEIVSANPKKHLTKKIKVQQIQVWLNESYNYWPQVYNTEQDSYPSVEYKNTVLLITNQRIALAGYRLSNSLNEILD